MTFWGEKPLKFTPMGLGPGVCELIEKNMHPFSKEAEKYARFQ